MWFNVAQDRQIADPWEHGNRGFYTTRGIFLLPELFKEDSVPWR
jgi:hypothetical protein